jgi:hypothetical protein
MSVSSRESTFPCLDCPRVLFGGAGLETLPRKQHDRATGEAKGREARRIDGAAAQGEPAENRIGREGRHGPRGQKRSLQEACVGPDRLSPPLLFGRYIAFGQSQPKEPAVTRPYTIPSHTCFMVIFQGRPIQIDSLRLEAE